MLSYVQSLPGRIQSHAISEGAQRPPKVPDQLNHVILTTSHLQKDPNSQLEKLRVIGAYTSLSAAEAAAHRVLFEAGYEGEMFKVYEAKPKSPSTEHHQSVQTRLEVHAEVEDGTIFEVYILSTPNHIKTITASEDGRVLQDLYHVMQTGVSYNDAEHGHERAHNIRGSFLSYEDASQHARQVLLDAKTGVSRDSYAQYDEAEPGEKDCGYGENVLVHAVGTDGENILISVVLGQVLESARLAEAAMRIR